MVIIPNIHFSFRKGGGSAPEIIYGTVELRPTAAFQASTSLVLPAPTAIDLINGEGTATNVYPTPAPVNGQVEWAYRVKVTDRHGKTFEWMVGVPDSTGTVEFASLPRYYETKPPLFGQGPKGDPGQAATISIGTTTSGTTPNVTNSGTNTNAVLNFTLPKGDKGDKGDGVPTGGTALQYLRKNSGNTATEWVSASGALASASSAGFMSAPDKALLDTATELANPNSIVRRSSSGRVFYPDPALPQNPVTLGYLENALTPFVLKDTLVWNVLDHGAKGDGVTDDTVAVNELLASVPSGSIVCFPYTGESYRLNRLYAKEGTYLKLAPNVRILRKGLSYGVTNLNADGSSPLKNNADPYSGHGNITIDGGIWDGNIVSEAYVPTGYNCHFMIAARNLTFKNMEVRDVVTNHAIDLNGVSNVRVENCRFLGYLDGTTEQNRQYTEAIQYGPTTGELSTDGAWIGNVNGTPSRGIVIEKSVFGASGTAGTGPWPTGFGNHSALYANGANLTGNITIRGNEFRGNTFMGITVYTYNNVKIESNFFYSCKAGIRANNFTSSKVWDKGLQQWVAAPSRARNLDHKYLNNTFYDSTDFDISVLGTGVSGVDGAWDWIEDVTIAGNSRVRTLAGRSSQQFIRVIICKDVKVVGNTGGHSSIGIELNSCEEAIVEGNSITNTAGYGILVSNATYPGQPELTPSEASVTSNNVFGTGTHGIGINGIAGFSAVGNNILNCSRVSSGGVGILFSGSDMGLVSANRIRCTSLPFSVTGIAGSNSTNTNVTYDNKIDGVTTRLASLTGAGTSYGNIVYT